MADSFAPPTGPPPPEVPEGWKAQYNDQYQTWFYVNLITKKSQWEKPTAPATADDQKPVLSEKATDHNPSHTESDEEMARRLQAEESSRAGGGGSGAAGSYYQGGAGVGPSSPMGGTQLPPRDQKKKGLLGSLKDKLSGGSKPQQQAYGGYPQQYPQQQYGYPQQHYGGYPPQHYGGYPPQQYGAPGRRPGMGPGAGLALGAGAGLLGGAMIGSAMADGGDDGGYGGDDGGGDMGGDGGGGDF